MSTPSDDTDISTSSYDTAHFQAEQSPTRSFDKAYPSGLREREQGKINERRKHVRIPADAPLAGMALSGGGIRSATFSLGVFQGLARQKLVRRIDFLSTVSGGGYFGSFLGALFQRQAPPGAAAEVEQTLANSHSWPVRWLRENGRFLSPNGAGDTWTFAAAILRNWVAVQVVVMTFVFMLLCLACLLRSAVWRSVAFDHLATGSLPFYERYLASHPVMSIWWSPFLFLPALTFAAMMFPTGALYWLTQNLMLMRGARRIVARFVPAWAQFTEREVRHHLQNLLTRGLTVSLLITCGLLVFAGVDSLGQTVYAKWAEQGFGFPVRWTGLSALGMVAFGLAQKIFMVLEALPKRRAVKLPLDLMALLAALAWAALIWVGLSVGACALAWRWQSPWTELGELRPMDGTAWLGVAVLVTGLLSWWFSRSFAFVNLSSYEQLYAARLKRAYIGASNPERRLRKNYSLTNPLRGDEIALEDYRPYEHGGPLHLINVTVNETVSGKSQIEQRDRKGLTLAVGPCGLSVGLHDHALWGKTPREVEPILHGSHFHALHGNKLGSQGADPSQPARPATHPVESLRLGHWVSISGAAFTTGLGQGTTLGLSLLLGLSNVRLGYWWDSGVAPQDRTQRTKPRLSARLGEWFARLLPVQACLFDEMLARFHGPARKHWYLSDGGHFENTGYYELIRRRLPFIIASDAGRDMNCQFADIANLVRKARTDFSAEIEFLRRRSPMDPSQHSSENRLPALEDVVHPEMLKIIGAPEDFMPVPGAGEPADSGTASPPYSARHAMLARVRYVGTDDCSWILFLKPSLTGDEPGDVLQYQKTQPDFPQESTMDQYFDEAQWESYRKLGEHIASLVFARPTAPPPEDIPDWSPSEMRPPPDPARRRSPGGDI